MMAGVLCLPPALRHAAISVPLSAFGRNSYQATRLTAISLRWSSSSGRTYADALNLLAQLQSNRSVVTSISTSTRDMNQDAIPEMLEWTRKAGYVPGDFADRGLRCIHVAGTKGKGSVCALIEGLLLQYRGDTVSSSPLDSKRKHLDKIGTYTSPHLITVRERIRIDGFPISESLFARYFFDLWDRFSALSPSSDPRSLDTKPAYFRYLTILALHTFLQEGVQTAIVECGIGGEYDSTNILPPEAVTASVITSLGLDHIGMLGQTIEEIAWHKAGIMKPGVPAYTIQQAPAAQATLEKRAIEKGVKLQVMKPFERGTGSTPGIELALEGDCQLENASLAVPAAASHLLALGITDGVPEINGLLDSPQNISDRFRQGLRGTKLQARFEVRKTGNIEWLIDGAHTIESIEAVGKWFVQRYNAAYNKGNLPAATILIFNQQDRDAEPLIRKLLKTIYKGMDSSQVGSHTSIFTYAAFCSNTPFRHEVDPEAADLQRQEAVADVYGRYDHNWRHMCYSSIEEAVELVKRIPDGDEKVLVLATGSLYLVGGLLKVLEQQKKDKVI